MYLKFYFNPNHAGGGHNGPQTTKDKVADFIYLVHDPIEIQEYFKTNYLTAITVPDNLFELKSNW